MNEDGNVQLEPVCIISRRKQIPRPIPSVKMFILTNRTDFGLRNRAEGRLKEKVFLNHPKFIDLVHILFFTPVLRRDT